MSDAPDARQIQRDLEALILRVRDLETASSPYAQQMLAEFRDLQRRVSDYAEHGTPASRRELRSIEKDIGRLEANLNKKADQSALEDIKDETESNRAMVRSALIAATLSLGVGIILFILQRIVK